MGQTTTNYEHVYAGKKHLGNIDVTNQQQPVNGKVWRWEGGAISYQLSATSFPQEKSRAGERGVLSILLLLATGSCRLEAAPAPQRSSASATQFYALNDERNMQRKSYRVG